MKKYVAVFVGLLASVLLSAVIYAQGDVETSLEQEGTARSEAALTLGVQGGEDSAAFYGDILVPLSIDDVSVWLVNVRGAGDDASENELNIGLAYRHLLSSKSIIIGGNIYYDSRWTESNNQFDQLGVGLELLSMWVDARFNYYLPEGGEKLADSYYYQSVNQRVDHEWDDPTASGNTIKQDGERVTSTTTSTYFYESYEHGREGYDAEVGFKLPVKAGLGEYRIFGGYYHWESEYTTDEGSVSSSDVEGFKARIEARVLPVLSLDVIYYDDEELYDTEWIFGARLRLPFDFGLVAAGKNPFAGAFGTESPDFASRRFEMVMRDLKIQTEQSGYKENMDRRKVDVNVEERDLDYELNNVTFVDDDASDDPSPNDPTVSDPNEDGTAEHP